MNAGEFADGLNEWLHGEESYAAEAACVLIAETLLMHRAWLNAHRKDR